MFHPSILNLLIDLLIHSLIFDANVPAVSLGFSRRRDARLVRRPRLNTSVTALKYYHAYFGRAISPRCLSLK